MKSLGRLLLLLIIIIIGAPIGAGALALQQDVEEPTYFDGFDYTNFDYESELDSKMQSMMMSNVIGQKSISIDEEFVSKLLFKQMKGYNSEQFSVTIPELNNTTLSLYNMWVTFNDGIFSVYGLIGYNNNVTSFTIQIQFEDYDGFTEITFKQLKIGKLPLPKSALSSGLVYAENNDLIDITDKYTYGQMDLSNLALTIDDEHVNEELHNALGTDLVVFKELRFDNQKITLFYDLNENNPDAKALNTALNEIKSLVSNEQLRTDLDTTLDSSDPVQQDAKEDIENVLDILSAKVEDPDVSTSSEFTEEEQTAVQEMADSFTQLPDEKQDEVAQTLIDNMDPNNKAEIEGYLSESTGEDVTLNDFISQFLGAEEDNTTN